MVETNYSGLNPVVVQALNNLQYRYSGETPEMWCSRVRYPFKTLLENNLKYFSKNGFIQMIERSYKDGEFKAGRRSFNIYCTVCDSLVIIRENTIKCGNDHLKKCIAKTAKKHIAYSNPIQKNVKKRVSSELSDDEIEKIYQTFGFIFSKYWAKFSYAYEFENRKRYVNHLIDSAKVVQRVWRAFKLRPETWAKQVWNMVRNDGSPNRKKYLGIFSLVERRINPQTQEEYDLHTDEYVNCLKKAYNENLAQKYIKEYLAKRVTGYKEYNYFHPSDWVEWKKFQLNDRLNAVAYIVAFIKLHQQGYRIVTFGDWSLMLKCLANPEYHHISKVNNNIVVVKSLEYARYMCENAGKQYPCDSLEINYFKSEYTTTIEGKSIIIDFSDFNNNCEYVQRVFRVLNSLLK
ncbi:hypothetical protein RhiirA5_466547 [Rhizophagus irregularis]|uniref:Uncharacterized protein n=1 Tax=Rhizophagus irregularis TaxID=588596 RepID=A0A2N0NTK8_9GLOM|nr:hypothetical protein RhiirA5_466547 [Rhizophagus irregularis]